jgi:septal ring factor EnvC (AmiA/AmiB activator)
MRNIVIMLAAAALLGGCGTMLDTKPTPPPAPASPYLAQTAVQAPPTDVSTVDSAVAWSEKYAKAVEEMAQLQKKNMELNDQRQAQQAEMDKLKLDLADCQKQLRDANAMLVEMKTELVAWKSNVLGYRQEILAAQEAQMEAMKKVLKMLGADVPGEGGAAATAPAGKQVSKAQP